MTAAAPFSQAPSSPADMSALNFYGTLTHSDDVLVLPSTTIINSTSTESSDSHSVIPNCHNPLKTSCLKPYQSETVFALSLFIFGLTLLIYVNVSYWFTHNQISSIIIFICGLLCFIPGCYYLIEKCSLAFKYHQNRYRSLQSVEQDYVI